MTRTSRRDRFNRRFKQLQQKADAAERRGDEEQALEHYQEMLEIIQGAASLLGENGRERILKQRIVQRINDLGGSVDGEVAGSDDGGDFGEPAVDEDTDEDSAGETIESEEAYELREASLTFGDVGGRRPTKHVLRDRVINPVRQAEKYAEYELTVVNGVLLYGPPGTGKTMLAKAMAGELGIPILMADNATLKNRYHGESEGNVKDLFAAAREHQPCMVFLDDGEGLLGSRDEIEGPKEDMVRQFLTEMTELVDEEVLIVATTNKPEQLDYAALRPERFTEQIKIGYPPEETRAEVLRQQLTKGSRSEKLGEATMDIEALAADTHGYTCADLKELADQAALEAVQHEEPIGQRHLDKALAETQASMNME